MYLFLYIILFHIIKMGILRFLFPFEYFTESHNFYFEIEKEQETPNEEERKREREGKKTTKSWSQILRMDLTTRWPTNVEVHLLLSMPYVIFQIVITQSYFIHNLDEQFTAKWYYVFVQCRGDAASLQVSNILESKRH